MSDDTTLHNVVAFKCAICQNRARWDLDQARVETVYEVTVRMSKRVNHTFVPVGERGGVVCGSCREKAEKLWKRMKGNEHVSPIAEQLREVHESSSED